MNSDSKSKPSGLSVVLLAFVLCTLALSLWGCAQPGETAAEGDRRHERVLTISQQQLTSDVDTFLLTDKPSKLSDMRVP